MPAGASAQAGRLWEALFLCLRSLPVGFSALTVEAAGLLLPRGLQGPLWGLLSGCLSFCGLCVQHAMQGLRREEQKGWGGVGSLWKLVS